MWSEKGGDIVSVQLTKDADKMICEIYAAYLNRRSTGASKQDAANFAIKATWPEKFASSWDSPDGSAALVELKRAGLVKYYQRSAFVLNDKAIIYMENRFKNGASEVLDWLGKIKATIPFI